MKVAVFPGSFDPITLGHIDILIRAVQIFDKVIVAVLHNVHKNPLFTVDERISLIEEATKQLPNMAVDSFQGLLVDYVKKHHAMAIIRGLRETGDFQNELNMAQMNHTLYTGAQTIFLPTQPKFSFVSSSLVKEVAKHGGDIFDFVPQVVGNALREKYR